MRPGRELRPIRRWTPSAKFHLVQAVRLGRYPAATIQAAHKISDDEWRTWCVDIGEHGAHALRVTKRRGEA